MFFQSCECRFCPILVNHFLNCQILHLERLVGGPLHATSTITCSLSPTIIFPGKLWRSRSTRCFSARTCHFIMTITDERTFSLPRLDKCRLDFSWRQAVTVRISSMTL